MKHRMGANSIKMYDKHGRSLRVESTVNDPSPFKVLRPAQGNPDGACSLRPLRRSISDLGRRAQLSQAANERYLEALASLNGEHPMQHLIDPHLSHHRVAGPPRTRSAAMVTGRPLAAANDQRWRVRPRRISESPSARSAVPGDARVAPRVTRKLRLLRAHGIICKVGESHRYLLTDDGRAVATAILQYRTVTLDQLEKAAA